MSTGVHKNLRVVETGHLTQIPGIYPRFMILHIAWEVRWPDSDRITSGARLLNTGCRLIRSSSSIVFIIAMDFLMVFD